MTLAFYDNFVHIGSDQVLVKPNGMTNTDISNRLKTTALVKSGRFTKSGREYVNFAPEVVKDDKLKLNYTTMAELGL